MLIKWAFPRSFYVFWFYSGSKRIKVVNVSGIIDAEFRIRKDVHVVVALIEVLDNILRLYKGLG